MSKHDDDGTKFSILTDGRNLVLSDTLKRDSQNVTSEAIVPRPQITNGSVGSYSLKIGINQQASHQDYTVSVSYPRYS